MGTEGTQSRLQDVDPADRGIGQRRCSDTDGAWRSVTQENCAQVGAALEGMIIQYADGPVQRNGLDGSIAGEGVERER